MSSFINTLQKVFGREVVKSSKSVATDRLRFVLVHDRADVSPQNMKAMREDIIHVISKYMEINEADMEINFTESDSSMALVANIPISSMRRSPRRD